MFLLNYLDWLFGAFAERILLVKSLFFFFCLPPIAIPPLSIITESSTDIYLYVAMCEIAREKLLCSTGLLVAAGEMLTSFRI